MTDDTALLLEMIGLRPVIVDDLGRDALLFKQYGLVLIDSRAGQAREEEVISQILGAAAMDL